MVVETLTYMSKIVVYYKDLSNWITSQLNELLHQNKLYMNNPLGGTTHIYIPIKNEVAL